MATSDGHQNGPCTEQNGSEREEFSTMPMELESDEHVIVSEPEHVHYLGVLPLSMIVFYNVSGGPFGIEEAVRSAGFFVSILGFCIMPFVWSVPEALITAELGSTYPEASGGVAWVEEAFGSVAGWQAGYLGWIAGATDNAIYPVLFLDYVFQMWTTGEDGGISDHVRFLMLSLTSIGLGFLNWLGLNVVGNMTIIIGLLSMAPFVIMVLIGMFKVDPSRWKEIPSTTTDGQPTSEQGLWTVFTSGVILWRPLLNSLFWNLNSYDATASYSAEVRDPGYVLPRALMWGVVIMMAGYIFPILVAIGATDSEPEDWVDGYLTTAAEEIGGAWLGAWVVFAAGVSNIGMFQAELSADAFQLMGMAERGFVPKIFATRSRHGTPTYGIILGVAVIVGMGSFNLEQLIEMLNFNYALALLLEYGAFMRLRIAKPEVHRPFRIPLGTVGSGIFLSFPVIGILIILSMASYMTMVFSLGINLAGLLIYYFYRGTSCSPRGCCSYSKVPVENPTTVEPSGDEDSRPAWHID